MAALAFTGAAGTGLDGRRDVRLLRCEGSGRGVDGATSGSRLVAGRARRCVVPSGSLGVRPGRRRARRRAGRDPPAGGRVARRPGRIATAELEVDALMRRTRRRRCRPATCRGSRPCAATCRSCVDEAVPAGAVAAAIREAGGDLLASCVLFDVHSGPPLPAGTKSLAFSVEFRAPIAHPRRAKRPTPPSSASRTGSRRTSAGELRARRQRSALRGLPYRLRADGAPLPLRRRPLARPSSSSCSSCRGKVKADPAAYADRLRGRSVALIFEKPSTRTRVSFEVGVARAGRPPAGALVHRAPAGTGRDHRGHRPRAQPVRGRHRAADVRAGAAGAARVRLLGPGRQLAVRLRASVPGARRPVHGPRAPGRPGGPDARLLRRRQQRRALAAARGREGRA